MLNGDGSAKLEGRGLAYADITANAGESFVVHIPSRPRQFASCLLHAAPPAD